MQANSIQLRLTFNSIHFNFLLPALLLFLFSCNDAGEQQKGEQSAKPGTDISFDREKWASKEDGEYPYRGQMVKDVVYNDTIRTLSATELIELLGAPDRTNDGHLYYHISRTGLGPVTLNAKTMVVKLTDDQTIEWIKIHG